MNIQHKMNKKKEMIPLSPEQSPTRRSSVMTQEQLKELSIKKLRHQNGGELLKIIRNCDQEQGMN